MAKDWKVIAAILIGGVALTIARRWNNKDPSAGAGVAGWTIVALLLYL